MARRGNDIATPNWAIASLGSFGGAGLAYNAYELVNRVNGLGVELAVYSGGIGKTLPQAKLTFSLADLTYNYFYTPKPLTFSDFDLCGAFVGGVNAVVYSASKLEVYDENHRHLINETFTGWGLGIPSIDIGNGFTSIVWDSMSDAIGLVQMVLPEEQERKKRFPDIVYAKEGKALKIHLAAEALFAFDRANLDIFAEISLHQAGKLLRSVRKIRHVLIEGHTDSVGKEDYNQRLSERRAQAVADWFKQKGYLKGIHIIVRGKGENEPIAKNMDPRGRALNRRVTVSAVVE